MTSFFWNVRGFNKQLNHSVVKKWTSSSEMKFGCILETRVKEKKANGILHSVFNGWSHMMNYECSQGGRIWLVWRETVCVTPVYKTDQMITSSVKLQGQEEFFCTFIYASNQLEGRKELWDDLCHHKNSLLFKNKAWSAMGDFNEILDVEESSGFSNMDSLSSGMRDFQRTVLHCKILDMGYRVLCSHGVTKGKKDSFVRS